MIGKDRRVGGEYYARYEITGGEQGTCQRGGAVGTGGCRVIGSTSSGDTLLDA